MRKVYIFSLFIAFILSIFLAFSSVYAQNDSLFSNAKGNDSTQGSKYKIHYCGDSGGNCTITGGLEVSQNHFQNNTTNKPISVYIQDIVAYLLGFMSLIGVIYIIWAGFRVMTSAGNDDEVATSKKTILYVAIGLIVMWLAFSIVKFIIEGLGEKTANTPRKNTFFAFNIIPTANAQAYTESESGTFGEYKYRVQVAAEELEAELKIHKKVSPGSITKLKSLVQQAFDRLPDKNTEAARVNESNKRYVDMKLDLAMKELDSMQAVGEAISQVATFVQSAKIETIQGSISANPTTGNAPLVTSFTAQGVIDPSGTIPPNGNYIWWIRENGGIRRELGRGPSLTHEFTQEGTYTVNLDVTSASRNSKGRTDVLPLSTSVNISVQPKLGEITLLINGVNVTNMNEMKISPAIAAQGLIFDATASRAIGNGRILETKWDFGNGNTRQYKSAPGAERQVFATSGEFPVKLEFKTNDGKTFSKDIMLRIIDPAATIKAAKLTANAGESLSFSAETFFGNIRNVEYLWTVQNNETGKRDTQSENGTSFNYTFKDIGSYTVTLTAKSPNGNIDSDSKTIQIESREPTATLDAPKIISPERPNTFLFDASRSFDPDTNSRQGLTYTWRINGEAVTLDELPTASDQKNSKGTYTFDTIGENTVSVTIANKYGKIATAEQKFTVDSILAGNLLVTPQVVKVGDTISLIAQSPNAQFFTWNLGDGSPQKSGDTRVIQHSYKTTGNYNVTLTLQGEGNSTTHITRRVYVSDMDSPLAIINFSNSSNSAVMEAGACNGKDAYVLRRGETSTLNAGNSVNVDGSASNLDYTWRFMGKVSTLSTITENFKDLGCFPISLTVKSKTNGASHTTTEYIKLTNQSPQLTNISTTVDTNKKDSQKLIVKATANGVSDPDGVITSYIWYYKTASDEEPQGLQITQRPEMTFVLPNITEKYYFGVIIEDNDGARIDSSQYLQNSAPLIIDNENNNINMPLITLNVPNKIIKVGQNVTFSAEAKTIIGTNVTNKSQYSWDFDGDGKIDEKTNTPSINHTFNRAGDYNMRVRVTNNGVSNTKYHTISVRNELKAKAIGYKLPNGQIYLLNTSQGVYDKAKWIIGSYESTQLEGILLDEKDISMDNEKIGTLQVSSHDTDISNSDILTKDIETISQNTDDKAVIYQSYPKAENNIIKISDPSEVVKLSLFGNTATSYAIDTDLDMDGSGENMDGVSDNDIDNREHKSYNDGSLFTISDFGYARSRERKIKITLYDGVTPKATQIITILLDFIPEIQADENSFQNIDVGALTDFEKQKLETLASMIRSLENADRIILMQKYNALAENWMNSFEKAKNLVDFQLLVEERNLNSSTKAEFSKIIDELLLGDADTTNAVTIATTLIKNLLPPESANYAQMVEKIDAIASHPSDREANKQLGEELLVLIQQEPSSNLKDEYKSIIHSQLRIILAHGDTSAATSSEVTTPSTPSTSSGGITTLLMNIVKILGIIVAVISLIGIGLFIFYKIKSTDENMGFQDFMIDLFAHGSKSEQTSEIKESKKENPITKTTPEQLLEQSSQDNSSTNNDPFKNYTPPTENADPLETSINPAEASAPMPDWLNPNANNTQFTVDENIPDDILAENISTQENIQNTPNNNELSTTENQGGLPDWFNANQDTPSTIEPQNIENPQTNYTTQEEHHSIDENFSNSNENLSESAGGLPDWLKPVNEENFQNNSENQNNITPLEQDNSELGNGSNENNLPDWLQNSHPENEINETIKEAENSEKNFSNPQMDNEKGNNENMNISQETFNENAFSYTSKKTENEEIPDWINNISANSVENSENISKNIEQMNEENIKENSAIENNSELPDWLQNPTEIPFETENHEKIHEKIEDTSKIEALENIFSETTNNEANHKTKTLENNSELPDWLQNPHPENESNENITEGENFEKNFQNNNTISSHTEIPDWLVDSANNLDNSEQIHSSENWIVEENSISKNENILEKTEEKVDVIQENGEKISKKIAPENTETTSENSIPDWFLNNTESSVVENSQTENSPSVEKTSKKPQNSEEDFEEKIENQMEEKAKKEKAEKDAKKSDNSIPEWLK